MTRQQGYVMEGAPHLFLNLSALLELHCLPQGFPIPRPRLTEVGKVAEVTVEKVAEVTVEKPCTCPTRSSPAPLPKVIPFPPLPENIGKLKVWIEKHYGR